MHRLLFLGGPQFQRDNWDGANVQREDLLEQIEGQGRAVFSDK
jgi:hypothetical protein